MRNAAAVAAVAVLFGGCGLKRHKYDNPITKDTQQPDKVLFDKAVNDIEHSRFEIARLLLQNLINTYDTSEYLAKAKLAIADAWYREGGAHGLAQAEAEYKDFILFYPQMEESAEAQQKVCDIHFKQMEKPDRDPMHALRAEQECKQLLLQFPNSKFAPQAQQRLRDIQEVLAESEFRVGILYWKKGSFPASANRLQGVADQFPLYSKADEALWQVADSYHRMGDRFENQQVSAYQRIVKDYPLSVHAEDARAQLEVMKRPVPEVDPVRYAQQKYELENRTKQSKLAPALGMFSGKPDVSQAAKGGTPQMEGLRPTIPASVPPTAARPELGTNEVTITQPGAANAALDSGTEVRSPAAAPAPATTEATPANATSVPKPAVPGAITPETTATQQTMTPAQQKKAYAEQVKKMQQAQKVAAKDRKKKEAEQADLVKAAKKKNREKQDQKAPDAKQQPDAETKKQ
ncbi:MAG TPA: outer membrane protein assembly factor BamD [Candidatus Acidoferrum sp.]|nr:outer membrane protein assembly factor BamD [Candidatus Acidoferrum sp.]